MSTGAFLLAAWDWDPRVVAAVAVAALSYGRLCRWQFSRRALLFAAGLGLVLLALCSPLDALARGYLFSAHMLQHLLLVMIAPPLFLLGLPQRAPLRGSDPWVAWFMGVGAMWLWHLPALCDAAASSGPIHAIQTVSLLAMGSLFWWPVVGPRIEDRLKPLTGVLYLFTACVACSLLGIWITFAPVGLCPVFMKTPDPSGYLPMIHGAWGLTPQADQEIGGLLMWVPSCLVYLGAILALLARSYSDKGGAHG